jgi:hypothetical protein
MVPPNYDVDGDRRVHQRGTPPRRSQSQWIRTIITLSPEAKTKAVAAAPVFYTLAKPHKLTSRPAGWCPLGSTGHRCRGRSPHTAPVPERCELASWLWRGWAGLAVEVSMSAPWPRLTKRRLHFTKLICDYRREQQQCASVKRTYRRNVPLWPTT